MTSCRSSVPPLLHGALNLHAGVRIEAGDDLGRERLLRYAARPPLSLERLRRLPGGRVAYRLKYVARGQRGKYRVMTGVEFLARLAAITCPPRYPLTRFAGVLAPRSAWRREVVPKPRERRDSCGATRAENPAPSRRQGRQAQGELPTAPRARDERAGREALLSSPKGGRDARDGSASGRPATPASDLAMVAPVPRTPGPGDVIQFAPNIISVKHWDRLHGWPALRGAAARGLGDVAPPQSLRGRSRMSEVPRPAARARRHHRTRARATHPRPPGHADRAPAPRPCTRSERRRWGR